MRFSFLLAVGMALALLAGYALAAGGGGGGGGGSGGGGGGDGGSGGGAGVGLSAVACLDTGGVTFTLSPAQKFNFTRLSDGFTFEATGVWTGNDFKSEEVVFTETGQYRIQTEFGLVKNFTCPAFRFSCRVVELEAVSCRKNESGVFSRFRMLNDDVTANLKFSYKLPDGRILKHTPGASSSELRDLRVGRESPTSYLVSAPPVDPVEFEVLHELCKGEHYVYSRIPCTENRTGTSVAGEGLKCGGYLNIEDRVACRLELREEQREEYENFFPEECTSSPKPQECLETYQKVQKCWAFPNGPERIDCVKEEIGLGELSQEKNICNQLEGNERDNCFREFNKKIYSLVKFRLYNLEEEGEALVEKGLLPKEALVEFVVQVELKKQEFNSAKTKAERKQVILEVRELWKVLVSQIREGE